MTGKRSKMSSIGSKRSSKKRRRASSLSSDVSTGKDTSDWSTSDESERDDGARKPRKYRKFTRGNKSGSSSSSEESSSPNGSTSESEDKKSRKHGTREKKSGRRKERADRKMKLKGKRPHFSKSSARDKKDGESVLKKSSKDRTKSREKLERRSKHSRKEGGREKEVRGNMGEDVHFPQEDIISKTSRTPLQVKMDAQEQQMAMIRHNAEMAKARLASGDMKRARDEQAEMQRLYGTVDWRARKKLRSEKKRLERTIAAGDKLANLEEREMARMDAFRVALGLPTAEAQRQAEWRAEATRALMEQEATMKATSARSNKHSVIGPRLPHRSPI